MKKVLIILTYIYFSCLSVVAQNDNDKLVFDNFKSNIKEDMDYKAIIETFGQPDNDVGSGIYIYIYKLSDSTTMMIGCTSKILYAKHYNKYGDLLHLLIGDSKFKCNPASLKHTYLAILRPGLNQKEATINKQKMYTVKAEQLILYNDFAHIAFIDNGKFGYIPPDDLVKIDTFYFKFDFSEKDFTLDYDNELFIATKKQGFDINQITNNVIEMNSKDLNDLFLLRDKYDGAAAELYPHHFWTLLMTWNDKSIAEFITNLKVKNRRQFVDYIIDSNVTFPIENPLIYYELYYPKTFELINKYK